MTPAAKLKKGKTFGLRPEEIQEIEDIGHDSRTNGSIAMSAIIVQIKKDPKLRKAIVNYAAEHKEELRTG